jgi:4-amino-4-deoxy-L-arabinose transferase-like glycosyltransferase
VALALAVLAGIPFMLGKYFELKSPDPFDSGCYVYSAEHVLRGARIGYDEKPSAQAGTLLVNMLGVTISGFNETGSKVLQGLFQAAAFAVLFITIRRLYGSLAAVLSVTVASVYLSAPLIAKFGNVKEQFMIAFMIAGICCFVWYHLTGKWWWVLLTGTLLIWGPMFKQTGMSAIGAVGLFTLIQPVLHHAGWKKAGKEVLLLVAGACITLTPIILWYVSMDTPVHYWPYSFVLEPALSAVGIHVKDAPVAEPQPPATQANSEKKAERGLILRLLPGYVGNSWAALDPAARKAVFLRVLRYYGLLILPIVLALGAIAARIAVVWRARRAKAAVPANQDPGRFVLLFGLWWLFDMSFVWISPHTYEQYFLPLNASSATLGGCLAGMYAHRLHAARDKTRWVVLGLLGVLAMLVMSWHIFFGIAKSPYSGIAYRDRYGQLARDRGYLQTWRKVKSNGEYAWIQVSKCIEARSQPTDKIYVWGWVPGIYVRAQRMSSAPKAFEGTMHTLSPDELARRVQELLDAFAKQPPKFIVDTQNRHFPWDRPPLQLWPDVANAYGLLANPPSNNEQAWALLLRTLNVQAGDLTKEGFLRADKPDAIQKYDMAFTRLLSQAVAKEEALRYEALRPLREYVMKNYQIVERFGPQILFRRK